MDEISPKLQNQIAQFQQLQQQLQTVMGQKIRMDAMLKEMEMTIEELKKTPQDATVYRNVGSLMIKVADIPALLKERRTRRPPRSGSRAWTARRRCSRRSSRASRSS